MRAILLALGLVAAGLPTALAEPPDQSVLVCAPAGCATVPLPQTGTPSWSSSSCATPYVVHLDGPLVMAQLCAADGNGDGLPETLSPRALALVPVVWVIIFLVLHHDMDVADTDGDGVPDAATGAPLEVYGGYLYPCGFPAFCAEVFCVACTSAALRLEDADDDGAPDAVAAWMAMNGEAFLDQRLALPG